MRKLAGSTAVLGVLASVFVPHHVWAEESTAEEMPPALPVRAEEPVPEETLPSPRVRTFFTERHNRNSGMMGLHLDRPSSVFHPHGISLDLDGQPVWETCGIDFEWPDLVLAYSHTLRADNLRLRADTAQMEFGQRVGHPITPFQLHITGGNPEAPLGGIGLATYDKQYSLFLYNKKPGCKRTMVSFFNMFALGTDSTTTGTPDFFVRNFRTDTNPITVNTYNEIGLNGALAHTGPRAGFYGAKPINKPVITGSRSDGTALANLLSKLQSLGLIVDNTSP